MNERVWVCLVNYKYKGFLVELLYKKYQKREWRLNIILAVASSSSIAAWAVWSYLDWLWGGIIATSQLITAIKPLLPYNKYIKELGTKCVLLDNLNLEYERFWDKISNNTFSNQEIEDVYYELKKEGIDITRFSDDVFFDTSKKLERLADQKMSIFLRSNYNLSPTNE